MIVTLLVDDRNWNRDRVVFCICMPCSVKTFATCWYNMYSFKKSYLVIHPAVLRNWVDLLLTVPVLTLPNLNSFH